MVVCAMSVEIEIPHSHSLKERRAVLNRLKTRLRNKFNVSVAETGGHDLWNYAELGVVVVSGDARFANQVASAVSEHLHSMHDFILLDFSTEFIHL